MRDNDGGKKSQYDQPANDKSNQETHKQTGDKHIATTCCHRCCCGHRRSNSLHSHNNFSTKIQQIDRGPRLRSYPQRRFQEASSTSAIHYLQRRIMTKLTVISAFSHRSSGQTFQNLFLRHSSHSQLARNFSKV